MNPFGAAEGTKFIELILAGVLGWATAYFLIHVSCSCCGGASRTRPGRTARRCARSRRSSATGLLGARRVQDRPARHRGQLDLLPLVHLPRDRRRVLARLQPLRVQEPGAIFRPVPLARGLSRDRHDRGGAAAAGRARRAAPAPDDVRGAEGAPMELRRAREGGLTRRPRPLHRPARHDAGEGRSRSSCSKRSARTASTSACRSSRSTTRGSCRTGPGSGTRSASATCRSFPTSRRRASCPWERDTAICLADCFFDGEPLEADPRGILSRAIAAAEAAGPQISVGHELEFFLLRRTPAGGARALPAARPGLVYRMDPRVDPGGVIREMEDNVRGLGLPFVCVNQEYDPSQWEINTRFADALDGRRRRASPEARDQGDRRGARARRHVHGAGRSKGRDVRLPPPHLGLGRAGANVFDDPEGEYGLSETARCVHRRDPRAHSGDDRRLRADGQRLQALRRAGARPVLRRLGHRQPLGLRPHPGRAGQGGAAGVAPRRRHRERLPCLGRAHLRRGGRRRSRSSTRGRRRTRSTSRLSSGRRCRSRSERRSTRSRPTTFIRAALGEQFIQAFTAIKRNELRRFQLAVTDWELREYPDAL